MTTTDPTRRVSPPVHAADPLAAMISLFGDPDRAGELSDLAEALRDLAGTLDRIAARRRPPPPARPGWAVPRGR